MAFSDVLINFAIEKGNLCILNNQIWKQNYSWGLTSMLGLLL